MGCLKLHTETTPITMKVVWKSSVIGSASAQCFMSVDPLASDYPNASPYNYVLGNPIRLIDPNGMNAVCPDCPETPEYEEAINSPDFYLYDSETGYAIKEHTFSEITITGSRSNSTLDNVLETASDIWNSPIARRAVPDKVSINLSSSLTAFVGFNKEISFNWITRGHDAQLTPYVIATLGIQRGPQASGDALVGVSVGYFATKDMRSINPGVAANGLLGWSVYGSADAGDGVGGSITGSVGFLGKPFKSYPTWISGGISGGASIGAGWTGGISYSVPVFKSQFKRP